MIRSSVALPGIFPPVHVGNDVLVDGGVMNNLPTDIMLKHAKGGTVIAIDVSGDGADAGAPFESQVSGWRELRWKLNPFAARRKKKLLSIFDVLLNSTVVASRSKRNQASYEKECDLYLNPDVNDFSLLGFEQFEDLYRIGYETTAEKLEKWDGPNL